jgi:hypothetical protein
MIKVALAVSLSLFVLACGGSSKEAAEPAEPAPAAEPAPEPAAAEAPQPSEAEYREIAERVLTFARALVAAAVENENDCDAMGAAMQKVADENRQLIQDAKRYDGDEDFGRFFAENYQETMAKEMQPIVGPLSQCGENKQVQEAMKSLDS